MLVGAGLSEAVTSLLVGPGDHERAGLLEDGADRGRQPAGAGGVDAAHVAAPRAAEAVLAFNAPRQDPDVAFFEIGHVFGPPLEGEPLPDEPEHLAVAIAGADATAAVELWSTLADALRLDDVSLQASPPAAPTRTALIVAGPERRAMGVVGEIDPDVLAAHASRPRRPAWAPT